jgi:hypothetical protein
MMRTGWHISWAARGIEMTSANACGIQRDNESASGFEKISSPHTAKADNIKPYSTAHHGFHNNMKSTAQESMAIPVPGRPTYKLRSTTTAITAALSTLGCGVTNMTKNTNAVAPHRILMRLPPPHRPASMEIPAVTMMQLAPETAVM